MLVARDKKRKVNGHFIQKSRFENIPRSDKLCYQLPRAGRCSVIPLITIELLLFILIILCCLLLRRCRGNQYFCVFRFSSNARAAVKTFLPCFPYALVYPNDFRCANNHVAVRNTFSLTPNRICLGLLTFYFIRSPLCRTSLIMKILKSEFTLSSTLECLPFYDIPSLVSRLLP